MCLPLEKEHRIDGIVGAECYMHTTRHVPYKTRQQGKRSPNVQNKSLLAKDDLTTENTGTINNSLYSTKSENGLQCMLKKHIIRRKWCWLEGCELFICCMVDITTAGAALIPNGDKNVTGINIAVVNTGADTLFQFIQNKLSKQITASIPMFDIDVT